MAHHKLKIPNEVYDRLVQEAIRAGLRSPQDKGEKGLTQILSQWLAAAHTAQPKKPEAQFLTSAPQVQEPPETPAVVHPAIEGKRVIFWLRKSKIFAIRKEGILLGLDSEHFAVEEVDGNHLYRRENIVASALLEEAT